jgi:hypothetical protein
MPLGLSRVNTLSNNQIDYGTYQGYFRSSSSTVLNAYNTSNTSINSVTHGCGTINQVRAVRIPGRGAGSAVSHIVGVAGATNTRFYTWSFVNGFTQLISTSVTGGRTTDIAVDFSRDRMYLAATISTSPFIRIYEYSISSGVVTAILPDPATLPAGTPEHICFSPDGKMLAVTHATSPFLRVYSRSGTTFTSQTLPGTNAPTVAPDSATARIMPLSWNANSNILAYPVSTSTMSIYYWNGSSLSSNNTASISTNYALNFNPNPTYANILLVTNGSSNPAAFYQTGVIPTPSVAATAINTGITARQWHWSPDGLRVATAPNASSLNQYQISTSYTTTTVIATLIGTATSLASTASGYDWLYY